MERRSGFACDARAGPPKTGAEERETVEARSTALVDGALLPGLLAVRWRPRRADAGHGERSKREQRQLRVRKQARGETASRAPLPTTPTLRRARGEAAPKLKRR